MVSSRLRTTIVFFALCGLIATSAFAGVLNSTLVPGSTNFAHEIAATVAGGVTSSTDLTFAPQIYTMGIARNQGQNFILRYTLSNGAVFGTTFIAGVAQPIVPPAYSGVPANVSIVQRSGGVGASTVEFDVNVLAVVGTIVGDTFTFNGQVRFPVPSVVGATTTLTVDVRDVISALDTVPGPYTRTLATLVGAASIFTTAGTNPPPNATIDATAAVPLTSFVADLSGLADADTTGIAKAFFSTSPTTAAVRNAANTADYVLLAGDKVTITLTGDFTGIAQVAYNTTNHVVPPAFVSAPANTTTNEVFTIAANLQSATITVDGNRLTTTGTIWFTKTAAVALNPRVFGISESIVPVAASQTRTIGGATTWYTWVQNGTVIVAPYVSFTPGNGVKFRFTNASNTAITLLVNVVLDQGTFTQAVTSFTVPATGSQQITFSDAPTAGTGELGPIASALLTGVAPVRGKVTFTALTGSPNVTGIELIYSPVGVVTLVNLPQQGPAGWEK